MWRVWDGNNRHPLEVLRPTKMWNLREFHTEGEHTMQPRENGKNEAGRDLQDKKEAGCAAQSPECQEEGHSGRNSPIKNATEGLSR